MEHLGEYDTIVVGAGVTGIVASVAAARAGAHVLLVESSGILGGLITGGRLTKPTGVVQPGVYLDLIERAASYGGADPKLQASHWGHYSGVFDTEVMQRVIIETLEEAEVKVMLFAHVTGVLRHGNRVHGVELHTKAGPQLATAATVIDASGDGDVAAFAGVDFAYGRPGDGHVQPMTSYFRILNVEFSKLAQDCLDHPDDIRGLVIPEGAGEDNDDYVLKFYMAGFEQRIAAARRDGFDWIIPKTHLHMKAGLLPGELNVNATRVQGNALDPWTRSRAAIEVRKQAYCAFDFLKRYVGGMESAVLFDIASVLGVRETGRVEGDYMLTEHDVRTEARFPDAIGLSNAPLDIHEPGGEGGAMIGVNSGYGIPYRCLLPRGVKACSSRAVACPSTRAPSPPRATHPRARSPLKPRGWPPRSPRAVRSPLGSCRSRSSRTL